MEIRLASPKDAQALVAIYTPYVLSTNITFEVEVPTVEDFASRIETTLKKYPYYVAIENNQIVGYAYASAYKGRAAYDWVCELSIYIDMNHHSKGIGQALYTTLIDRLRKLNYQIVYACISYPNDKSEQFHKKLGFKQIAYFEKCGYKFNQWVDMIWMEKRIASYEDIQPIKSIQEL